MDKKEVISQAVIFTGEQIQDAWTKSKLKDLQLISTNKKYRALPKSVWDQILAEHLSLHEYVPELFDCDAFSASFMGAVAYKYEINGIVRVMDISGKHSYNAVLVVDSGNCSWKRVEPQADIFIGEPNSGLTVTAPSGAYAATSGFAITV